METFLNESSSHPQQPMATVELVATLIPLCTIALLIIFGNVLVIAAVFRRRSLRTPQNIYLVSLAGVDLSVAIFILPLNILNQVNRGWYLGVWICKFYVTLDITLCTSSILHLCCIALDRFKAITEGIQYIQRRTLKRVLITIGAVTVLSIWISSPPILGWDKDWLHDIETTKRCELLSSRGYVFYSAFGGLFLPTIMMVSLYIQIFYALRERIRKRAKVSLKKGNNVEENVIKSTLTEDSQSADDLDDDPSSSDFLDKRIETRKSKKFVGGGSGAPIRPRSQQFRDFIAKKQKFSLRKERNAAQTLGTIMAAFIVCWLPFAVMYVVVPFCCADSPPPPSIFEALTWLGYINSALNPVIYSIFNLEFRKEFKKILHLS